MSEPNPKAKKTRRPSTREERLDKVAKLLNAQKDSFPVDVRGSLSLKGDKVKPFLRGFAVYHMSCQKVGQIPTMEGFLEACVNVAMEHLFQPSIVPLAEANQIWDEFTGKKGRSKKTPKASSSDDTNGSSNPRVTPRSGQPVEA